MVFCVKSAWRSFVLSYRAWSCLTTSRTSLNAFSSLSSAPRNGTGKRTHIQTNASPTLTRQDRVAEVLSAARVQRGPSEAARCASTESALATPYPLTPPLLPPAHAAQRPLSVHRDQPRPRGHLPPFARSSEPPEDSPPAAGAE